MTPKADLAADRMLGKPRGLRHSAATKIQSYGTRSSKCSRIDRRYPRLGTKHTASTLGYNAGLNGHTLNTWIQLYDRADEEQTSVGQKPKSIQSKG